MVLGFFGARQRFDNNARIVVHHSFRVIATKRVKTDVPKHTKKTKII